MSFNDEEAAYLRSQRLARIATVSPDGQPDVVPVGFEFDGTYVCVGGMNPDKTRKLRQRTGRESHGRRCHRRPGLHRSVDAALPADPVRAGHRLRSRSCHAQVSQAGSHTAASWAKTTRLGSKSKSRSIHCGAAGSGAA